VGNASQRIVIIGSSISGGLAACYLKLRFPDCEIVCIQKRGAKFPIVGESLTEFSTLLLHEIGLGAYLEEQHFHKYGLTFYFKEKPDDPSDYTYSTHEAPRIPPMPSNQVNRFTLASRLLERAAELGIRLVDGAVTDVCIGDSGVHRVSYTADSGEDKTLDARWVVDASGRNRFLAKKLGLQKAPRFQRSSFWFRLEGFDKRILREMVEIKTQHHCFDSYYVTHHFFGRHNWMWAIPMRPPEGGDDLISIGIVYRPDLYGRDVTSLETFLSFVSAEHPVVAKLVQSGKIVDTNTFRNYFYETARNYSARGWFIIGDAGDTVDPLYSTGMATTSVQIKQVTAIIDADRNGVLTDEFVDDLQTLYKKIRDSLQYEISTLYEVMDDAFQAHLRVHSASMFYFHVLLPSWLCGYIADPTGAKILIRILENSAGAFESLRSLFGVASARLGRQPAAEIRNLYGKTVNWQLAGPAEERFSQDLASCSLFFARIRLFALRRAGWHRWFHHLSLCIADVLKAALLGVVLRRRAIKELGLVRRMGRFKARSTDSDRSISMTLTETEKNYASLSHSDARPALRG
jgi:flavin-dependent dehydrogenase